ncbi:MAG TPA: YicC/YloC family endoribonuclease [Polyangia bacterium]|jgi:uncharacterized protein (TIGR00255 family)|nr:YicC/YloC family endoribonuclease [Polyangia bacterium]
MTGFGRASTEAGERRLRVEIRSVNHRGLDLKIRGAESDAYCGAEIGRAVRAAVERGAVTVVVRDESAGAAAGVDEARVRAVHAALEQLRQELEIEEPVGLSTIAAFMTEGAGGGLEGEALWEALRPAVEAALGELCATRKQEGRALAADIGAHRARLLELAARLREATAPLAERYARRLSERLDAFRGQPGFEPGRIAQEAALMADRLDVSEELVRLETHLAHAGELVQATGVVGRKLDFVIQEIGRELNTIGSKAQDAGVAALVIDAKAELERMREQAQNIE